MSHASSAHPAEEVQRLQERIERLEAEAAAGREAQKRLNYLTARRQSHLDNTPLAAIFWDTAFHVLEWNPAAERIFGYTADEAVGEHALDLVVPDDIRDYVAGFLRDLLQQRGGSRSTNDNITKEGRRIVCDWYNTPVVDDQGKVVGAFSLALDITQQRETEHALSQSEGMLRSIVEHAPVFVVRIDRAGCITYINRVAANYTLEQVLGAPFHSLAAPEYQQLLQEAVQRVFDTGATGEYEVLDMVNNRWYQVALAPIVEDDGVHFAVAICLDIHDQKEQNQALVASEEQLRMMTSQTPAVLWTTDTELRFTSSTGAGLDVMGLAQNQVVGMTMQEFFQTDDRQVDPLAAAHRALAGESVNYEHRFGERWYRVHVESLRSADEAIIGAIGIALDFTEQKVAEEALLRSKQELEDLVAVRTQELREANCLLRDDHERQLTLMQEIRENNDKLQSQMRMLRRMLYLHDRDRQLIAYEIHDGIVQYMTGINLFLQAAESKVASDPEGAREDLQTSTKLLGETIEEARRLIDGLRPGVLEEQGVVAAVKYLCAQTTRLHEVVAACITDIRFERLAPAVERAIYRIVQEGLNNIVKHSQSPRARVVLSQRDDSLIIKIEDWGVGFDRERVETKRYGLVGIRDRARLLGGEAKIRSEVGAGTRLRVKLPLEDVLLPQAWLQPEADYMNNPG